jgi:hypothetical protein
MQAEKQQPQDERKAEEAEQDKACQHGPGAAGDGFFSGGFRGWVMGKGRWSGDGPSRLFRFFPLFSQGFLD